MARKPMVTRTILTTTVEALCVNTVEETTFTKNIKLPRTYKDTKALLKAAHNAIDNESEQVVSIRSYSTERTRYGMSEEKFIEASEILPLLSGETDEQEGDN